MKHHAVCVFFFFSPIKVMDTFEIVVLVFKSWCASTSCVGAEILHSVPSGCTNVTSKSKSCQLMTFH